VSKASTHDESEDIASPQKTYDSTTPIRNDIVKELLASHRGFMMKKLEIQELWKRNKVSYMSVNRVKNILLSMEITVSTHCQLLNLMCGDEA
jgi:hypothetical protein